MEIKESFNFFEKNLPRFSENWQLLLLVICVNNPVPDH